MSQETGEKQFAPSEKKLKDSAEKGDVLRSRELATAATVLVGTAWLSIAGPRMMESLITLARGAFQFDSSNLEAEPGLDIAAQLPGLMLPVMVLGLMVAAASLISQLSFSSGRWVPKNLNFKASRVNPGAGLKRIFGPNGLIEMGKGILKVILLGAIAAGWAYSALPDLADTLGKGALAEKISSGWNAILSLLLSLCGGLIIIAMIDLPIQWIRRNKRLMMSHQDMRDEHKQAEGSPEARAARKQRQRDIATGSIAGSMQEAQFVVTNPSRFAIALTYDPNKAAAPIVLAKGRGEKAQAIREMARELDVPLLEYPQLARSLFYTTREQQVIREDLYASVAMIVAFIFSVRRGENPQRPVVEIPVALRFDVDGRVAGETDR